MRRRSDAFRTGFAALCAALILLFSLTSGARAQDELPRDFLSSVQKMQESGASLVWSRWERQASRAEGIVEAREGDTGNLEEARDELTTQSLEAKTISDAAAAEIARLTKEQQALGPPPEPKTSESPDVAKLRGELNQRLAGARDLQSRADLVIARAEGLITQLSDLAQRRFLERLTTMGLSPANPAHWLSAAQGLDHAVQQIWSEIVRDFSSPEALSRLRERAPISLIAFVLAAVSGLGLQSVLVALMRRVAEGAAGRSRRLLIGVTAAVTRFLLLFLIHGSISAGLLALELPGDAGNALMKGLATGAATMIYVYVLGSAYFSPASALTRIVNVNDAEAGAGYKGALLIGFSLLLNDVSTAMNAVVSLEPGADSVVTFIVVLIGSVGFWRLSHVASCVCSRRGDHDAASYQVLLALRRILMVAALAAPSLSLVGYEFAARSLFFPSAYTVGIMLSGYLIYRVLYEAVDIRITERNEAEGGAQPADDDGDDDTPPAGNRLRLLPVLAAVLLCLLAIPLIMLAWGADTADLQRTYIALAEGVAIGEVRISPVDFGVFLILFIAGYMITRFIQRILKNSILPRAGVSEGASEALVSGFGYIMLVLVPFLAISATGIDLSNLAIVAGALSVGIGFGLQNIVNNFVSGIILLIERPVKAGDWIEVGGVHGYVRKVNVRSTEIETFDKSNYILPNSDLIAGAVTNYTLSDKIGRVIVPVHVRTDADTRKVESILLEVGHAHPMVLRNPPPVAYFLRFGDSALEFDLRVMIRNVNWIFAVRSELNHALMDRFRKEGIDVPFPQRDLHLRSAMPFEMAAPPRMPEPQKGDSP